MDMIDNVRRMRLRDQLSLSEIAKRTGLSRNTVKKWLKAPGDVVPKYQRAKVDGKLTAFEPSLHQAFITDSHRPKQARRSGRALLAQIQAQGYRGGYSAVTDFVRHWRVDSAVSLSLTWPEPSDCHKVSIKYVINTKSGEGGRMGDGVDVLQEVPLAWRQRQPRRVLFLSESDESAPLSLALERGGWEVVMAEGPSTWLQVVRRLRPSVVICDLGHAGVAGLHLAREIRADPAFRHMCLVAIALWNGAHVVRAATVAGFNYLFGQPVGVRAFEAVTAGYGVRHGR